jgi:DNA polymerase-3 subunit epsilon
MVEKEIHLLYFPYKEGKMRCSRITSLIITCAKNLPVYMFLKQTIQYNIKECDGDLCRLFHLKNITQEFQVYRIKNSFENQNMVLVDRGTINERSIGALKTVYRATYYEDYQNPISEILKNIIIPMQNNGILMY